MAASRLKNCILIGFLNASRLLQGAHHGNLKCRSSFHSVCLPFGLYSNQPSLTSVVRRCIPQTSHSPISILAPPSASLHSTTAVRGLEEFFDDPKNWGQPSVKAGRAWSKDELRLKDYVTLHKLWYVLLKERNMLITMDAEAERQDKFLPSPERINKVEVSMNNLKAVLKERQEALTELHTGHKEEHPGEWQYTPFGYKRYVKPKEYRMPKYMNQYWATKRKSYDPYFSRYLRLFYEQQLRRGARERRRKRARVLKLKQRFPDSDVWE